MTLDQAVKQIGPLKNGDLIEIAGQGYHRVGETSVPTHTTPKECWNDARFYSVELLAHSSRTYISYQLLAWAIGTGGARVRQPLEAL